MAAQRFNEMLEERFADGARLCVGLDPKPSDVAKLHKQDPQGIKDWLMNVVDATAPEAAAYKPNLQFYMRWGSDGIRLLEELKKWMSVRYPHVPCILDAKWGDIGDTNLGSAEFARRLGVQAVTISPYLGMEAMRPLLEDFFCFVLCKTSNSGSGELQNLVIDPGYVYDRPPLHMQVARNVQKYWQGIGPGAGLVVGATYPLQLEEIDSDTVGLTFLIPGVGKQGGTVDDVMANMKRNTPLINVSSGVTGAENPAEAARQFNTQIKEALAA